MTLYEQIYKIVKEKKAFNTFKVCNKIFVVEIYNDIEFKKLYLRLSYDNRTSLEWLWTKCEFISVKSDNTLIFKIIKTVLNMIKADNAFYRSSYGTIHDINHGRIIKEFSKNGEFYGWRVTD